MTKPTQDGRDREPDGIEGKAPIEGVKRPSGEDGRGEDGPDGSGEPLDLDTVQDRAS